MAQQLWLRCQIRPQPGLRVERGFAVRPVSKNLESNVPFCFLCWRRLDILVLISLFFCGF